MTDIFMDPEDYDELDEESVEFVEITGESCARTGDVRFVPYSALAAIETHERTLESQLETEREVLRDVKREAEEIIAGLSERAGRAEAVLVKVLEAVSNYGQIDGEHHKAWVIDLVARLITGAKYSEYVAEMKSGEDGPETYGYDEGIAP